jgi:hypothetical protein
MSEICKTKLMSFKEGYTENNRVKIFYRDYGPADATPYSFSSWIRAPN